MHGDNNIVFSIFLIFTSAAILATVVLYTRQSLLVAYMLLGMTLGPSGLKWVSQLKFAQQIGDIGIIFLLFLLGLDLTPRELAHTLRKTTLVTVFSTVLFAAIGFVAGYLLGFTIIESLLIATAMVFSSTIIALKLLPTTMLHHKPIGETMISVLLMQDFLAIGILLLIHGASMTGSRMVDVSLTMITLPALLGVAFFMQHYVISKLFIRFDQIKEYIFLLAIGWCLGLAELARVMNLSAEIGAFIAGISIAEGPIAAYIAESLKPLRDFCLVLFFFAIGASFNLKFLPEVIVPALVLAVIVLVLKPIVFKYLLQWAGEKKRIATEVGYRLGQNSEFSLLIAYLASSSMPLLISDKANYLIQATTLLTFIGSCYYVALRYPTPVAFNERMRRD